MVCLELTSNQAKTLLAAENNKKIKLIPTFKN